MSESYPPPGHFLRIKDWETHFERAQTKKVKGPLAWVAVPTQQDGLKFSRLMAKQNGTSVLGVFLLLVEIAARSTPRGSFWRPDADPMTSRDIARMSGTRASVIEGALKVLVSKEIGWVEVVACSQSGGSTVVSRSDMREREEESREEEKRERAHAREAGAEEVVYPEGLIHELPVRMYFETFRPERIPAIGVQEQIVMAIGEDLGGWKETLVYWQTNGYRPESIGKMLDHYREQLNGGGRNGDRRNDTARRDSGSSGGTNRESGVKKPTPVI